MTAPRLDPEGTDQGALERVMLLETLSPLRPHYNQVDSLAAMRLMRTVIENRLRAPQQWGAPGATTDTQVIAVGNQFAGFGSYPILSAHLQTELANILNIANAPRDQRTPAMVQFMQDAITAATEVPPASPYPSAVAWRTSNHHAPGRGFTVVAVLQGNTFFATQPVPPMPRPRPPAHRHPHHGAAPRH